MSGTSLDGIDVAVVDIQKAKFEVVAHQTTPYKRALRERILAVSNTNTHTAEIARLHFTLAELYADAVKRCGVPLDSIDLVGCHGQTIFHEGTSTLQIGDGSVLAERLGVPVVSDFRTRDIAAGGQGAPLVPFVDYRLYASRKVNRVSLNLGGIGNITVIPAAAKPEDVIAFDTGPGNMVMDQLVTIHTGGKQSFDRNGRIAAKGKVHRDVVDRLMRDPFYRAKPPKSAGREQYGREFVAMLVALGLPMEDLVATATAFTARTVAEGVRRFAPKTAELVVSGGGVRNPVLMRFLSEELPGVRVAPSSEFGIDPDAKEAIAFAIMAYETWHRRPSNLPSATGARHPVILGKVSY
jgi:anhydro-N-acetylmuramic acid kinase